jgi:CRISPR/Cas system-associated endoribonuclease Cas2
MSVYLLTYDLTKKKPEFDYQILWDELKRLDAVRIQESVWLLNVNNTAAELRDHFKSFTHDDDLLWVSGVYKDRFAYTKVRTGTNAWLKANPPT